jgi:hypothetical protein
LRLRHDGVDGRSDVAIGLAETAAGHDQSGIVVNVIMIFIGRLDQAHVARSFDEFGAGLAESVSKALLALFEIVPLLNPIRLIADFPQYTAKGESHGNDAHMDPRRLLGFFCICGLQRGYGSSIRGDRNFDDLIRSSHDRSQIEQAIESREPTGRLVGITVIAHQ